MNGDFSTSGSRGANLDEVKWDHSFVKELPGDPRVRLARCYIRAIQVPPSAIVKDPQLVSWSESVAQRFDIDPKDLPYGQCYGGHRFGVWAGQLGDGRAITLGEFWISKVNGGSFT